MRIFFFCCVPLFPHPYKNHYTTLSINKIVGLEPFPHLISFGISSNPFSIAKRGDFFSHATSFFIILFFNKMLIPHGYELLIYLFFVILS